eukprot:915815-Pleurochrysis_carterae.AAC.1
MPFARARVQLAEAIVAHENEHEDAAAVGRSAADLPEAVQCLDRVKVVASPLRGEVPRLA